MPPKPKPAASAPPSALPAEHVSPGLPALRRRVIGRGTRETILRQTDCPGLTEHGMIEIGQVTAGAFYVLARPPCPCPFVLLCTGGEGRVAVGGRSFEVGAGQALLVPPGPAHELRAENSGWVFCLFFYDPLRFSSNEVALVRLHCRPIAALVEALVLENHSDADPIVQKRLVELIDLKLRHLANPIARADQLAPVWAEVARRPEAPWDLPSLAGLASVSTEHLRRLSRRETGRTPMEQVTWIRIQHAATLLITTNDIIEEIAARVGYASVRAFRVCFIRIFGRTPKAHRVQGHRSFAARADRGATLVPQPNAPRLAGHEGRYPDTTGKVVWRQLPLTRMVNTPFAEGERPWFGQPLLHVRAGLKHIHGVPFRIEKKGCVFFLSERFRADALAHPLPASLRLPVSKRARRVFFLHACGWGSRSGPFAAYRFFNADGLLAEVPLHSLGNAHPEEPEGRDSNIQDWYFAYDHVTRHHARPYDLKPRADPTATSQFLYTLEWTNPRPERPLVAIEIVALPGHEATLALLAITLEARADRGI